VNIGLKCKVAIVTGGAMDIGEAGLAFAIDGGFRI